MFLNPKQDIKTIKEFWGTFKEKAPFLTSFIKVLSIITKWVVLLFIIFCVIVLSIEFYTNIQKSKAEAKRQKQLAEYQRQLGETEVNYQKCLDKTVKIDTLKQEWRQMSGWKEWRCGASWELYWVDWVLTKYPDLCSDYNLDSIRFFLNEKLTEDVKWMIKFKARYCP